MCGATWAAPPAGQGEGVLQLGADGQERPSGAATGSAQRVRGVAAPAPDDRLGRGRATTRVTESS